MSQNNRFVIIGLGNVGRQYESSRHNIGFDVVDQLAAKHNLDFVPGKGDFYQATTPQSGASNSFLSKILSWFKTSAEPESAADIILLKPTTLMNRSGLAAQQALEIYGIEPQQLMVVVDDFHLPLGKLRLRKNGSDGGHNGLKSIINELETDDFPRLRVGIGPKPPNSQIIEFVLGQFAENERPNREKALSLASDACEMILTMSSDISIESKNLLDIVAGKYNIRP